MYALRCVSDQFEKNDRDFDATFTAYQEKRIPVLGARELDRVFHVDGVERVVRNAWLKAKTPEDFRHSIGWLYGTNGAA